MRILSKLIVAAIAVACFGIVACNTPSDTASSGTTTGKTPDQKTVESVKNSLTVPNTIRNDQKKINLLKAKDGAAIKWSSNSPGIIDADGNVTHQEGNASNTVELTATITKGKASDKKNFTVKVDQKSKVLSAKEILDMLTIPESVSNGQNKIELPKTFKGAAITWSSDKTSIIDTDGNVTHQEGSAFDSVELTAAITKGADTAQKKFTVKVYQKSKVLSAKEILDMLTLPESVGNDQNKIDLPTTSNGAAITWSSDKTGIIDTDGTVTHQEGTGFDTVSLTASVTTARDSDQKIFTVQVEQKPKILSEKEILDMLTIPESVSKNQKQITLPKTSHSAAITWTSDKTNIIDENGKVTHQEGTDVDEVILTAEAVKEQDTAKKQFTVKVYQKNKALSPKEILDEVDIPLTYNENTYEDQTISMKDSQTVEGKTVTITYNSNDEKHLKYDQSTKKITIHHDIADVTALLSATLTCGGEHKTKQIPVVIKHIPELKRTATGITTTFTFDGTCITKESTDKPETNNARFSYTADTKTGLVTLTKTHIFKNGEWCDEQKAVDADIKNTMAIPNILKATYNAPTLENFRSVVNATRQQNITNNNDLITYILKEEYIRNYFDGMKTSSTVEDFKKIGDTKQADGIRKFCIQEIKAATSHYNIPSTESFVEMFEKMETAMAEHIKTRISKTFFARKQFQYKVLVESNKNAYSCGMWFEAVYMYDNTSRWYKQVGSWSNISYEDRAWKLEDRNTHITYYGNFNTDYTQFTYSEKEDQTSQNNSTVTKENGSWTFGEPVVDAAGKVSMKANKTDSGEAVTLEFSPASM
ncbi:MAG: immunoglobulin-like domain-containing protein [Treponema sp.]